MAKKLARVMTLTAMVAAAPTPAIVEDTPKPETPKPDPPGRIIKGRANYATILGPRYLAMRLDRGTRVRICGAGGCVRMRTTDYGPKKTTGDIADIALGAFAKVCGWSLAKAKRMGECDVRIKVYE